MKHACHVCRQQALLVFTQKWTQFASLLVEKPGIWLGCDVQAGYPVTMLSEQYRMHPAISAWPSLFFYQGKLTDGTSALPGAVASRAADFHKRPCFPPLAFFDCQ